MKLAGMASNRGRNLLNIADTAPGGSSFTVILTNDESAPVLEDATERGIPTEVVEHDPEEPRAAHEQRILDRLAAYEIDLVCLDGFMRILTDTYLDASPTTINIHPSLLPSFPGLDAHQQVLDADVSVSGCTVHVVDETIDGGPIITQEPVPVFQDDTQASLKERVLYTAEFVAYPRAISWIADGIVDIAADGAVTVTEETDGSFPTRRFNSFDRVTTLRYGENPHQDAAVYVDRSCTEANIVQASQLNAGARALSYNNYNDTDAALSLIKEFDRPAAAVIKHTNPAGCAVADDVSIAYDRALATDPMSAFGGIVALNRECDEKTASAIVESFKEVVVAPGYSSEALAILTDEDNLRVLDVGPLSAPSKTVVETDIVGGRLIQDRDLQSVDITSLDVVTDNEPTPEQLTTMKFAWQTIKHVKSNAIVFAKGAETVGIGMGQVSRVDAVRLASLKADEHAEGKDAQGAIMASDAFFPFPDGIEYAAEAGIDAVIQPGGSVNDDDVIAAANELDMSMVFTGQRAFKH